MSGKILLGVSVAVGFLAPAEAALSVARPSIGTTIVHAAEGCGPGFWRGPAGYCHPFAVARACPIGYHLGPEGQRCWPNGGYGFACPPGFHLGPFGRHCWPG